MEDGFGDAEAAVAARRPAQRPQNDEDPRGRRRGLQVGIQGAPARLLHSPRSEEEIDRTVYPGDVVAARFSHGHVLHG